MPVYLKKNNTLCIKSVPFDADLVGQAARRGLPFLLLLAGVMIKNSLINYSMEISTGDEGVAFAIILISVFVLKKKPSIKTRDLLKLSDDFGANEDEYVQI